MLLLSGKDRFSTTNTRHGLNFIFVHSSTSPLWKSTYYLWTASANVGNKYIFPGNPVEKQTTTRSRSPFNPTSPKVTKRVSIHAVTRISSRNFKIDSRILLSLSVLASKEWNIYARARISIVFTTIWWQECP